MQPKESKTRGKMEHLGHDLMDAPVYRSLTIESRGFQSEDPPRSGSTVPRSKELQSDFTMKGRDLSSLSMLPLGAAKSSSVSSMTKSFDALDLFGPPKSAEVKAPPLIQECPTYFELSSSFLTNKLPTSVFDSVIHQLGKKRVDYEYEPSKLVLRGIIYNPDDCDRCIFKLKLFKAPSGRSGKYLVEFQRRYGCIVTFRNLYQHILQALLLEGIVIPISGSSVVSSPISLSGGQVRLDQETLDVLIRSLGNSAEPSTNIENLRETLRVLATLSKTQHNRAVLAEARTTAERTGLCDLLLWVLHLEDSEVRRCGATLLGNVASLETIRGELVSKLLASMFHLLSSTDPETTEFSCDLMEKEIQRQVAKTLAIVTETHASEIAKDVHFSQYMQILAKHRSSSDEGLGADVLSTMQRLTAAGNPITSR